MKVKKLSHIDPLGNPKMVDVSSKKKTRRTARASATLRVDDNILRALRKGEWLTRKGPVFQTAILAGIAGAKKTSELIPLCHPLGLDDCRVEIRATKGKVRIDTSATVLGRTGVEMEALTAASVAALTVYDMCKALSHEIVIERIRLEEKTGGKAPYRRQRKA